MGSSPHPPPRAEVVNQPGARVDLAEVVVPRRVTVVEFFADWCKPCRRLEQRLLQVAAEHPGLAVRKVDIGTDTTSAVARQHGIRAVPSVLLFDADGSLRYRLEGESSWQAAEIAAHLLR